MFFILEKAYIVSLKRNDFTLLGIISPRLFVLSLMYVPLFYLVSFFFFLPPLYDKKKRFIFNTASVIFAVSDPEKKTKQGRK